jgi:hypothetical protein
MRLSLLVGYLVGLESESERLDSSLRCRVGGSQIPHAQLCCSLNRPRRNLEVEFEMRRSARIIGWV